MMKATIAGIMAKSNKMTVGSETITTKMNVMTSRIGVQDTFLWPPGAAGFGFCSAIAARIP